MSDKIYYKKGYKYQLTRDVVFQTDIKPTKKVKTRFITLNKDGKLEIRAGYAWDGPSGPTYDSKNFMRGSLAHDALYQLMRMELLPQDLRLEADKELGKLCEADKMTAFRRWYVLRELRKFGAAAADPKNKKEEIEAP